MINTFKKKYKFNISFYILFLFFIIFFIKFSTVNANGNTYKVVDLEISKTYDNDFDKEVLNMELLANGSTDGFILSVAKETMDKQDYHHINEVIEQGMPVVMFDRVVEGIACDRVLIDDKEGARKGVAHMLKTGCRNVGIITTKDNFSVGNLRTEGYIEAHEKFGLPVDNNKKQNKRQQNQKMYNLHNQMLHVK